MRRTPKEAGDAWGRLFGLAVDACKSHHASHCDDNAGPTVIMRRDGDVEVHAVTVTESQHCDPSWTPAIGETAVPVDSQGTLAPPQMCFLRPGELMSTSSLPGYTKPTQVPPGGANVVVGIDPQLPRGLYVGRLQSQTGTGPPILIFIDDVT